MKEIIKINIHNLIKVLLVTKEKQQINKIANILITNKERKKIFMEMVVHLLIVHLWETYCNIKKKATFTFLSFRIEYGFSSAWANDYKNDQYI